MCNNYMPKFRGIASKFDRRKIQSPSHNTYSAYWICLYPLNNCILTINCEGVRIKPNGAIWGHLHSRRVDFNNNKQILNGQLCFHNSCFRQTTASTRGHEDRSTYLTLTHLYKTCLQSCLSSIITAPWHTGTCVRRAVMAHNCFSVRSTMRWLMTGKAACPPQPYG